MGCLPRRAQPSPTVGTAGPQAHASPWPRNEGASITMAIVAGWMYGIGPETPLGSSTVNTAKPSLWGVWRTMRSVISSGPYLPLSTMDSRTETPEPVQSIQGSPSFLTADTTTRVSGPSPCGLSRIRNEPDTSRRSMASPREHEDGSRDRRPTVEDSDAVSSVYAASDTHVSR